MLKCKTNGGQFNSLGILLYTKKMILTVRSMELDMFCKEPYVLTTILLNLELGGKIQVNIQSSQDSFATGALTQL